MIGKVYLRQPFLQPCLRLIALRLVAPHLLRRRRGLIGGFGGLIRRFGSLFGSLGGFGSWFHHRRFLLHLPLVVAGEQINVVLGGGGGWGRSGGSFLFKIYVKIVFST